MKLSIWIQWWLFCPVSAAAITLPNFSAKYLGEFQHLQDPGCTGSNPVLHVACRGTVSVISTSDASIQCNTVSTQKDARGFNYIVCTNSCQGSDCNSVWLYENNSTTGGGISSGPFGGIEFSCSGDSFDAIEAYMSYEDGGQGSCPQRDQANIRIGKLGVFCGTDPDFDSFYFECTSRGVVNTSPILEGDVHSCIDGFFAPQDNYVGNLDRFEVKSDYENFALVCVTTENGSIVPTTSADTGGFGGTGQRQKTDFVAGWDAIAFSTNVSLPLNCRVGSAPQVLLECKTGPIKFTSSNTNNSCVGEGSTPEVSVTYPSGDAACSGNPFEVIVTHAVQLGIICDGFNGALVSDKYLECGEKSNIYRTTTGNWRSCLEEARFPVNSTIDVQKNIPVVSITTDDGWRTSAPEECYEFLEEGREEEESNNVGIIFGALFVVFLLAGLFVLVRNRRNSRKPTTMAPESLEPSFTRSESDTFKEVELSVNRGTMS